MFGRIELVNREKDDKTMFGRNELGNQKGIM